MDHKCFGGKNAICASASFSEFKKEEIEQRKIALPLSELKRRLAEISFPLDFDGAIRSRDRGCAPAERFLDLYYTDLVADPIGVVRKVYAHFDLVFPEGLEEKIGKFLRQNPRDRFGKHRYRLEQFGLNLEEETRRYAAYRERFRL